MLLDYIFRDIRIITEITLAYDYDLCAIGILADAIYAHLHQIRSIVLPLPPHDPDVMVLRNIHYCLYIFILLYAIRIGFP